LASWRVIQGQGSEKTNLRPEFEPEGKPGPATGLRQAIAANERATSPTRRKPPKRGERKERARKTFQEILGEPLALLASRRQDFSNEEETAKTRRTQRTRQEDLNWEVLANPWRSWPLGGKDFSKRTPAVRAHPDKGRKARK
jgi:hypothetical protein